MLIDGSVKVAQRALKQLGNVSLIRLADKTMCPSCLQMRARPLTNLHRCPDCGARCCIVN